MTAVSTIKDTLNNLPIDFCGVDTFADIPIPFDNISIITFEDLDSEKQKISSNFSLFSCAAGAARLAAGIFLLPVFATVGTIYHAGKGLAHLGIALYEFYTVEEVTYDTLKKDLVVGMRHLIISVYNLIISALSPIIAFLYAATGRQLIQGHLAFHRLSSINFPYAKNCYSQQWAEQIVEGLKPKTSQK